MKRIIRYNDLIKKKKAKEDVVMCKILKKIKNKTPQELLKEYDISMNLPIDIPALLEKIGIATVAKDFSNVEKQCNLQQGAILGAAISEEDNLAIFYKKSDTLHRKLFTIAHELGHCCKHADNLEISHIELRTADNKLYANNPEEYKREIEANIFAGELLIPESILKEKYNEFFVPSLKILSSIFNVSTNVMAARLDYLRLSYFKDVDISEE